MDLSPNDIRNYEFPNQMRGYDKEEVDSLLEQIASVLENMKQEHLKLSMENDSLLTQLNGLKQHEEAIKNAAIDARKNADATLSQAKEQAAEMLAKATMEAQNLMQSHSGKIREFKNQFSQLEVAKNSFVLKIKELISSHMELVEDIEQNKEQYEANLPFELDSDQNYDNESDSQETDDSPVKEDTDKISVMDSAEVNRNGMETLATPASQEHFVTEEANAADENLESQMAQAMADAEAASAEPEDASATMEPAPAPEIPEDKPVDPELANALENYQNLINKDGQKPAPTPIPPETMIGVPPAPKQGEVVETSKRAEDIPDGFIAANGTAPAPNGDDISDTDRIHVDNQSQETAPEAQSEPTEHNEIDIDTPVVAEKREYDDNGNEIVKALDDVVAKFEEEMDRAAKN